MTKNDFLSALGKSLPHRGRGLRSVLNFYSEMIDDLVEEGLTEAEAIERIGTVEEVAEQIRTESPQKEGMRRSAIELALLILGAPLWFSLLLVGFSVAIALYAVLWSLILTVWALELPFFLLSLLSKGLLPACKAASGGALALTKWGTGLARRLFERRPFL